MSKPPIDPDYFDKVNFVIDSWVLACEAPWYIYVETLKPAALAAFITLATFGWDDVARGYFRPRGLGGRRSKKGKGKAKWKPKGFPELGELIGSNIPGAEEQKGKKWGNLGKTLWRIDTATQQVLFWWLVIDVTIDFAYTWASLLHETHWCQQSHLTRFSWSNDIVGLTAIGVWRIVVFDDLDYQSGVRRWFNTFGVTGAKGMTVTAAIDFIPEDPENPSASVAIRIDNLTTGTVIAASGEQEPEPDGNIGVPLAGHVPPHSTFRVMAKSTGSKAFYGNGVIIGLEDET